MDHQGGKGKLLLSELKQTNNNNKNNNSKSIKVITCIVDYSIGPLTLQGLFYFSIVLAMFSLGCRIKLFPCQCSRPSPLF